MYHGHVINNASIFFFDKSNDYYNFRRTRGLKIIANFGSFKKSTKMGKFEIELLWGFFFANAIVIWAILEKTFGLYNNSIAYYGIYTNLFAIVAIALYVVALYRKKIDYYNGKMTWRQGFVAGVYMTVVITVLSPICQYIIHKFIAPELLPNLIAYKVGSGYLSLEAAQKYFNLESYIYQSSSFALSTGVVTSAITAYFVRTKNYEK